jgi:predicted nuclease of predicted toxin-antitoxin system
MRFLADESCDFAVVRGLRETGKDVLAVAETVPGAADETVLDLAVTEKRVLLTEDKDFGRWIYAHRRATAGVILLRYPATARRAMPVAVVRLVERHGERLAGCFVVVQPGRLRMSRLAER